MGIEHLDVITRAALACTRDKRGLCKSGWHTTVLLYCADRATFVGILASCTIPSTQPIELGQHLPEILGVFNPQIGLLDLASATPDPFLRSRTVHRSVLLQRLVFRRHHQTTRTDDTVVGYAHRVVHA